MWQRGVTHVTDYFMAATFDYDEPYDNAEVYLLSPELSPISKQCLSFTYYIRSDLDVSLTDHLERPILAFHINSGKEFQQAFLELPPGSYQIIWKVGYDSQATLRKSVDEYYAYWAIIDDVMVHNQDCNELRKAFVSQWSLIGH